MCLFSKAARKPCGTRKKLEEQALKEILTLVPGGLWKIKQLIFLWLKENAIKSLVPNCYSKLARAIPKTACRGIFSDFQWKLGLKIQFLCVWIKGSSRVLSVCFYMLTHYCKNYFKQNLLALTLKLHPVYLLSSFARGVGNFAEGK